MAQDKTIEELEAQYKGLALRRDALQNDVNRVLAARDERKRSLKETLDECRKEGFNPDTLAADIQRLRQVLIVKLDVMSADLAEAETLVQPMLREIEKI